MVRLLCCALVLAVLVGVEALTIRTGAQQYLAPAKRGEDKKFVEKFRKTFYGPMRIQESKPVTVKDAQFVVVAQTEWIPPKPNSSFPVVSPLDIQLRITNLGKSAVRFPTYHTFGVKLFSADGKQVKPRSGRKGTTVTKSVLLPGGASYSIWRRAELRWDDKGKTPELIYYDGTGAQTIIGPVAPGRYKLAFWYTAVPDKRGKRQAGNIAAWSGEVVTREVLVEVVDGSVRGYSDQGAQFLFSPEEGRAAIAPNEILQIHESNPVIVNGAKFVAIAESAWMSKKGNAPIDIQLLITNLSKHDLVFHTFDTFFVFMTDPNGRRIMWAGGRNLTAFTRPVVIPKGASYALCRKAELRWNAKVRVSELYYWDGTGMQRVYRLARPGRYKLGIGYTFTRESVLQPKIISSKIRGDAPAWVGEALTNRVIIDVAASLKPLEQ